MRLLSVQFQSELSAPRMLLYLSVLSFLSTASPLDPTTLVEPPYPLDPTTLVEPPYPLDPSSIVEPHSLLDPHSPLGQPSPGYPLSSTIPCPSSWYDSGLLGLGCLLFHTSSAFSWEGANNFCQEEGGALVEVWTEDQHTALRMVLGVVEEHDSAARYCARY